MVAAADEYASCVGVRVWRSLIRRLLEMQSAVGPITKQFACTRVSITFVRHLREGKAAATLCLCSMSLRFLLRSNCCVRMTDFLEA